MKRMRAWRKVAALAATAIAALWMSAGPARAVVTAEQIDAAIERGVESLLASQNAEGGWGDYGTAAMGNLFSHGYDVCGLMGLAYGGVPASDERLQKALKLVLEAEVDRNYVYAVHVIALSRLYPRLRREQQELVKQRLMKDVEWIFKAQDDEGDWNYYGTGKGELSNTQMALLALYEGSKVLKELPTDVWKKALDRYLKTQKPDGGWNYGSRSSVHVNKPTYGSMTAAGVASLFIIRDKLYRGTGCPCRGGKSPRKGLEVDAAIQRGTEWLKNNFAVDANPGRGGWNAFWSFSCERVGLASGIKYFGTHNWYAEMAEYLVSHQNPDGSWGHPSSTALAIAFLVKGRAPILLNKLQFDGQWNNHPRDAANLADYVGKQKEQAIQWQVINLDVPVDEWHDAPILYITAETPIELTDEQKARLRQFTDTGGTLLVEASCGNRQIVLWWDLMCKEIWPEWELKVVGQGHPLWEADSRMRGRLPTLFGLSDGVRTFMFYSKTDISCAWNTQAVARGQMLFDLGGNLFMYSTDKGKLRARLAARPGGTGPKYAAQTPAAGERRALAVARIKHGGEWYLADNYHPWQVLAEDLQARAGLTLKAAEPVAPGGDVGADVALLHLAGRAGSRLDPEGCAWLRGQLGAGRFLLAEATLGDGRFDEAFRAVATAAGLALKPLPKDRPLLTGQLGKAAGYDVTSVAYTYHLQAERVGQPAPLLYGIYDGSRLVGVYSPFDILFSQTGCKAYGNRGYAPEDARAIATNIALLISVRE